MVGRGVWLLSAREVNEQADEGSLANLNKCFPGVGEGWSLQPAVAPPASVGSSLGSPDFSHSAAGTEFIPKGSL